MIYFHFTVNESLLRYSTHPITVPKGQVEYRKLVNEGLDKGDLTIIFPKGERVGGHMYYGKAGYGPYYQVRTHTHQSVPGYLLKGDELLVVILKHVGKRYTIVEFIG